jgi:GTP-binding protein LepA
LSSLLAAIRCYSAISAKDGMNVDRCWRHCPADTAPTGDSNASLRALIFDSHYDSYKGVVAYVRVMEGAIRQKDNRG